MEIAIVGLGRVGSALALCLCQQVNFSKLHLINRNDEISTGIRYDLMGAYPDLHDKLVVSSFQDAQSSDLIIVTAGAFGAPDGMDLYDINKNVLDNVFGGWKPKSTAKILVTSTPIDRLSKYVQEITNHPANQIIGFGGQLDVNRLKFLLNEAGENSENCHFIGKHGAGGIPVFDHTIKNRESFIEQTGGYFRLFLKDYGASTFATAQELVVLVKALLGREQELCISYWHNKHSLYITWPCVVNESGFVPSKLELNSFEQDAFDHLIEQRKRSELL